MSKTTNSRVAMVDAQLETVSETLGIALERRVLEGVEEFEIQLRLAEIPEPIGLSILIGDDYMMWTVELSLDPFARPLLLHMTSRYAVYRDEIDSLLKHASRNSHVRFCPPVATSDPGEPADVALVIKRTYEDLDKEFDVLGTILLEFFCLLLPLLISKEEWTDEGVVEQGKFEGSKSSVVVNRYERSRYNRALCLRHHGFRCQGCGNQLDEKYGPMGEGVIHVHHVLPISKMNGRYILDPVKDLVPLCPNCHNVVHRTQPPITVDKLRELTGY